MSVRSHVIRCVCVVCVRVYVCRVPVSVSVCVIVCNVPVFVCVCMPRSRSVSRMCHLGVDCQGWKVCSVECPWSDFCFGIFCSRSCITYLVRSGRFYAIYQKNHYILYCWNRVCRYNCDSTVCSLYWTGYTHAATVIPKVWQNLLHVMPRIRIVPLDK